MKTNSTLYKVGDIVEFSSTNKEKKGFSSLYEKKLHELDGFIGFVKKVEFYEDGRPYSYIVEWFNSDGGEMWIHPSYLRKYNEP